MTVHGKLIDKIRFFKACFFCERWDVFEEGKNEIGKICLSEFRMGKQYDVFFGPTHPGESSPSRNGTERNAQNGLMIDLIDLDSTRERGANGLDTQCFPYCKCD